MVSTTVRMPLVELEATGEWQILTPKQKVFLQAYLSNNYNAPAAVLVAYKAVEKNAAIFSYEILASPRIDRVLALHFGWDAQDKLKLSHRKEVRKLLRQIRFQLRRAEPGSVAAQRLTSQWQTLLLGGEVEVDAEDPEPVAEVSPTPAAPAVSTSRVPPGCRPARSKTTGELKGYLQPDGKFVPLAPVEVVR